MAVTIERVVQIRRRTDDGSLSAPWIVQRTQVVDGVEFLTMSKKDSGFCRFVSGCTTMNGYVWLQHLKQKRNDAAAGLAGSERTSIFGKRLSHYAKAKLRKRAMAQQREHDAFTVISLPAVEHEGEYASSIDMQVLKAKSQNEACGVEMTPDNIHDSRVATLAMGCTPKLVVQHDVVEGVPKKCTWNPKKKALIASRQSPGQKKQYKTFRPADDYFDAIDDARGKAAA